MTKRLTQANRERLVEIVMTMNNDPLSALRRFPTATREQILAIAIRNLYATARRNGAVGWEEIEYFLQNAASDFDHATLEL